MKPRIQKNGKAMYIIKNTGIVKIALNKFNIIILFFKSYYPLI